jgi:polynucleotide 5'-kinase involved in rRNA processing
LNKKNKAEAARKKELAMNLTPERVFEAATVHATSSRQQLRSDLEADILNSLYFDTMVDRHEEIQEAHQETFEWIYHSPMEDGDPWASFIEWLRTGDSIYWINGKAGSGKSTLMRYLYDNRRTKKKP